MIAHLSSLTIDPLGSIWLDLLPESRLFQSIRRSQRVKTLDGGAVLNDGGYVDGDRDLLLYWQSDTITDANVTRMHRLYSRVRVAIPEGVFIANIRSLDSRSGRSSAEILILSRLTE
jgi:hypothetical protein